MFTLKVDLLKKQVFFLVENYDFEGSRGPFAIDFGMGFQHLWSFEAQDEVPVAIDCWWILVGLGRQVRREDRAKIEQNTIENCIDKMIKNKCILMAHGVGR